MTRHLVVISCLLTWFCSTHAADGANLRTWTSKSGKYTVKAELLSFAEGVVTLRRADGKKIEIPIAKLSQGDQKHVLAVGRRKVDSVKVLEKLGAAIRRNERGEVIMLILSRNKKVTDAELVHLEGLINLQSLILWGYAGQRCRVGASQGTDEARSGFSCRDKNYRCGADTSSRVGQSAAALSRQDSGHQ